MNDDNAVRKKKLMKIARVVEAMRQSPSNNPASWRLLVAGLAGFFAALLLEYSWSAIVVGWFAGSVCGYFWLRAAKYQTWEAYIYALLADYDPVNKDTYSELQERTKRDGLDGQRILEWVTEERSYIGPSPRSKRKQAQQDEDKLRERFLSKKP